METREIKRSEMFALIEEYHASSETQVEFCARVGMKIYSFRYWLNRYAKHKLDGTGGFVRVTGRVVESAGEIELRFPNGVRIGLGNHPNVDMLAQLIRLW